MFLIDYFNTEKFLENYIRNDNNNYFCEIYDSVFLHIRSGGNWRNEGLNVNNNITNKLLKIL
jgi:hypothetical protein